MNIYDVSEKVKVSIATISRVLNGSPNINEKTRNQILDVMEELGYTPNAFARGLRLGTMETIGTMCPDSSDPYLASAIYYLERELRADGYDSILCCMGNSLDTKQKYFNLLLSERVDATILADSRFVELKPKGSAYTLEAAKDLPTTLVSGYLDGPSIHSTVCGDHAAIYQATESLIAIGHDNILYLYTSHPYSGQNKMQGYKDALATRHVPVSEELTHQCSKDVMAPRELLLQLWDSGLKFNGVVTSDGSLAVGTVKLANQKGIRILDECPIIGYNNSILSLYAGPELISIDTKVGSLCTTTINTLMGVFGGGSVPSRTTIAADSIKRQAAKNE